MSTKEKIISVATRLFNESGYGSVTIQDIANELKVGRRNIAYHYPNKEALLKVIAADMFEELEEERQKGRDFPSFENLSRVVEMYFSFQQKYSFIFNDLHVMKHPLLEEEFHKLCQSTIQDNKTAIAFSIKLGNMKEEPFPGAYYNLSLAIWALSLFWLPQQAIRKVEDPKEVSRVMWSLILPHFTEKGILAFKAFFGAEFFNSIGEPFEVEIKII